jgi:hypothetical protein
MLLRNLCTQKEPLQTSSTLSGQSPINLKNIIKESLIPKPRGISPSFQTTSPFPGSLKCHTNTILPIPLQCSTSTATLICPSIPCTRTWPSKYIPQRKHCEKHRLRPTKLLSSYKSFTPCALPRSSTVAASRSKPLPAETPVVLNFGSKIEPFLC